jgi:hypothetical protein
VDIQEQAPLITLIQTVGKYLHHSVILVGHYAKSPKVTGSRPNEVTF